MKTFLISALILGGCAASYSQINWSGQAAADFLKSGSTESPRAVNGGRPTFGWEADLFLDAPVTDDVAVLSNIRATAQEYLYVDYLAVRLTDLTPLHLNFQVGKFDMPFGNLGDRRYPRNNVLYGLPLIYEYNTAIQSKVTTEDAFLRQRGEGIGLRLLDGGIYDIGAMVYGGFDVLTFAFAISNGTVSEASYGTPNNNSDFGKIVRLEVVPMTGLTIGGAFGWGGYLYENGYYQANEPLSNYQQKTAEVDVSFSRGHFVFYGEGVHSTWEVPFRDSEESLGALGYYLEGKYTIIPRLYVALRNSALSFQKVELNGIQQRWDYNVNEWEGGIGYFVARNTVLKVIRRETRTYGGSKPKDSLTVLQLAVAF